MKGYAMDLMSERVPKNWALD